MTMTETTREAEARIVESLGHHLGCFEIYAEVAIENGIARTGEHNEIVNGERLVDRFARESKSRCSCKAPTGWEI